MKKNLKPIIVLGVICLVVAALLSVVNSLTFEKIADYEAQKVFESLKVVLDGHFENVDLPENKPQSITGVYKVTDGDGGAFKGHVVTIQQKGYASDISITVGIDGEGKTTKVVITAQGETHGKNINPLLDRLSNSVTEETVADVEVVSGATISSNAIKSAISDAFKVVKMVSNDSTDETPDEEPKETLPKTDEEILSLVKSFVGDGIEVTDITPEEKYNFAKRVYRLSQNKGYVVYVYSINERYGTVDTENLVHIGMNKTIQKIEKLTWSVSEAAPDWGYNPPGDERLDQLYADLTSKNTGNIDDVDLKTGATNTATVLVNTLKEALAVVGKIIDADLPRPIEDIERMAADLAGDGVKLEDITPEETNTSVKRVYRLSGNKGYIAYVYTIAERYGTVDTENLVYIGADGNIKKIEKLTWSVSDAAPDWGYNPPNEDRLNQLYSDFTGKNNETIGDVDLKTGATNTATILANSLSEALSAVNDAIIQDMPTPEDELKEIIAELVGKNVPLTNIALDDASLVRRLYSVNGEKEYVAYVVAISPNYGTVETESLIHISADGKIIAMKNILWKVSDPMPDWGYIPPSMDRVNQLYNDFVGKDSNSISEVDLKTGATSTGERLLECVADALDKVLSYVENSSESAKEKAIRNRMEKLVPNATDFEKLSLPENAASSLKALYKVVGFDGYVAYIITSTKYVEVETEALVYINARREVGSIELITWTVGHGIEPGDFATTFVGKNADELKEIELITGATATSGNLRDAVVDAINVIPQNNNYKIIGIVVISAIVVSIALVIIIKRRKNR